MFTQYVTRLQHRPGVLLLFLAAVFATGCGPDARDIGAANLALMPAYALLLLAPALICDKLLGRVMPWRAPGQNTVPAAMAVFSLISVGLGVYFDTDLNMMLTNFILGAPSCIALGQISWVVWRSRSPRRMFGLVSLFVLIGWMVMPSLLFTQYARFNILMTASKSQNTALFLWVSPGMFGATALLLSFGIGIYIYRVRKQNQQSIDGVGVQ